MLPLLHYCNTLIMKQHIHSGYQAPSEADIRLAIAPAHMQHSEELNDILLDIA